MKYCLLLLSFLSALQGSTQRVYADHSVLATGNWAKLGVTQEGIYKIDAQTLAAMGLVSGSINSSAIRIYGNGGAMLPESNSIPRPDDLVENAIEVIDGGDGVFNNSDYLLFYAAGPHQWLKDPANQRFYHQKNLYADTAFYYISISGIGKRIGLQSPVTGTPVNTYHTYSEHLYYESDAYNLLNSGKQWYGESFNNNGIGTLNKTFTLSWPATNTGANILFRTAVAGRTIGNSSSFKIQVANQSIHDIPIPSVSGYFLDAYAQDAGTSNVSGVPINLTSSNSSRPINFQYNFQTGNASAQGWLNWFELQGDCILQLDGTKPLFFRNWGFGSNPSNPSIAPIALYQIANGTNASTVWDINNAAAPVQITSSLLSGNIISFQNLADSLHEYVAFDPANVSIPIQMGKVLNQDLHHVGSGADFLIITHPSLLSEAKRLASFHEQQDGYQTVIALTNQIYQEFASGAADPTAIRDYVKMYYDQAQKTGSKKPRFLLLFGAGSYDPKNRVAGNTNLVPVYETPNSLDPLVSHVSDDFFGLLDDADDINLVSPAGLLDIGIGRIPAHQIDEAKMLVDKIIHYSDTSSLGAWRTHSVFIADDKDQNLHLNDAESLVQSVSVANPAMHSDKIYLDAFPLVSGNGGARYPAVNDAIVNEVFNGNLIVNYTGHGSYQRLAEESVLTETEAARFNNSNKLPLFITASCDFAPYDDPSKNSLGNSLLFGNQNGAIALMTTTRVVFAYSNRIMNDNYLKVALQPNAQGNWLSLGEATQIAKNKSYQGFGDVFNNRKFSLLGDPAMHLAIPTYHLQLTTINNKPISGSDSLRALGKYQLEGMVTDGLGNPISNFNGMVYPTVYDKSILQKTMGNDPASIVTSFAVQNSILYQGKATVTNGKFQFSFIVPKDINFQPGKAKISLYASNGTKDAAGADTSFYIAGISNASVDTSGPTIKAYLNDEQFKDGGLTNENPVLLLHLYDSSGISTSGAAIGHDITAIIDGNERNVLVLNNYYTAVLDSYQEGFVRFQLPTLAAGAHQIRIKAWDVANHSSEVVLNFVVATQEKLVVTRLMNYPNPFTTSTRFSFEHNQPNTDLGVNIQIFTLNGQLLKQIDKTVNTGGTRNIQIDWDGRDESGRKLKKATYIYHIKVSLHNSVYQEAKQILVF